MSIAFGPNRRRLTAADLACLPRDLPSGPVDFELDHGMLVVRGPGRLRESNVQMNVWKALFEYGEQRGHGTLFFRVGIVVGRNPDSVFGPRLSFWTTKRLPLTESPEEFVETPPDLAVEIAAPCDSRAALQRKANAYLLAGVRIVWVIDNDARTVTVSRAVGGREVVGEGDMLRAEGVIPDLEIPAASLFAS